MSRPHPGQEVFLGPGPSFLTTHPQRGYFMGPGRCGTTQTPPFQRGPRWEERGPACPHMLPFLSSIHPGTKALCSFWATPFSAAALRVATASEQAKQQLSESVSHMGHSPNLLCSTSPPLSTSPTSPNPTTFLQPLLWCSPGPRYTKVLRV